MKIDGRCHCGSIAYEAEIDPEKVRICHCTDCQRLSATAFRVSVGTPEENFTLLSGAPKTYVKIGENGARRAQVFCPDCGSQIYATAADGGGPRVFNLRTGTIDQRDELKPRSQIWKRSAQAWIGEIESLPARDMQ
ncbi:MAG: GFA family protein [Defluviicoccus sp.]|nr:GFA family protein [Defluviicoccus sp.]MDE0278046.1 GFA family protein [Defluviicoccus sp.]